MQILSGIPKDDPGGSGRFLRFFLQTAETQKLNVEFKFLRMGGHGSVGEKLRFSENASERRLYSHMKFISGFRRFLPKAVNKVIYKSLEKIAHFVVLRQTIFGEKTPNYAVVKAALGPESLLIFHPQAIGYEVVARILESRQFTWIFVLDSSFFCRQSYNHRAGESQACFECLAGKTKNAEKYGCQYFPFLQQTEVEFEKKLIKLSKQKRIGFFAQNVSQQRLLQKNFGLDANVIVTGMNSDFDVLTHHEQSNHLRKKTVVFHANPLAAKGVDWTIELAKQLPDFEFIFPFDRNDLPEFLIPKNCSFASMSWETGLKELISESEYVICPSLWSAPIEGALIKVSFLGIKCWSSTKYQRSRMI